MLIAFDIDGTLADLSHRLHLVKNGKPDWEAFFGLVHKDKPIPEMVELCHTLKKAGNSFPRVGGKRRVDVIFMSGRSSVCREATEDWLIKHVGRGEVPDMAVARRHIGSLLYMRSEKDRRPDYEVKYDLLQQVIKDYGQKPDLVFDDRQQVVDMWREQGIRCCQVAKGDF